MRNLSRLKTTIAALTLLLGSARCFGIPPCQPPLTIVKPDFSVIVVLDNGVTVPYAKVLLANRGQILVRATTDSRGVAKFSKLANSEYMVYVDLPRGAGAKWIRVDSAALQAESSTPLGYVQDAPPLHLSRQPVKLWRADVHDANHPGKFLFRPWANIEISLRRLQDDREVANIRTSDSGVLIIPVLTGGLYTVSQISHAPNNPETFITVLMVVDLDPLISAPQIDVSFPTPPLGVCSWAKYQIGAPDLQAQLKVN